MQAGGQERQTKCTLAACAAQVLLVCQAVPRPLGCRTWIMLPPPPAAAVLAACCCTTRLQVEK